MMARPSALGTRLFAGLRWLLPGSAFQGLQTADRTLQARLAFQAQIELPPQERYAVLKWYYQNNALYHRLSDAYYQQGRVSPSAMGLRNPAYRIVEFYPATIWPGDLPDALPLVFPEPFSQEHSDALRAAIYQTWAWSNWAQLKQTCARWLAMYGDVFIKVVQPPDSGRVYFELLDPLYVADFDVDSRGYITYLRIELPRETRQPDGTLLYGIYVEEWNKATQTYRQWNLPQQVLLTLTPNTPLPTPDLVTGFDAFGIDFIPVVHTKFLDVGETRGVNSFMFVLDKIDNVNREATRLAQLLYRHNRHTIVVSANSRDSGGRPTPAPIFDTTEVGEDQEVWQLPGMAKVDSLIPPINWDAHRLWVGDDLLDLQADCPELAWWHFSEQRMQGTELSGRAIRYLLGPAIQKALEVRGRAEDALARADMMALTIGQAASLPGFQNLGDYAQGDLEHRFESRDVIPLSEKEIADQSLVEWQTAVLQSGLGVPHDEIWKERGYTDDQIAEMQATAATTGIIPTVAQ